MATTTITFGERVENHAGMQMIGNLAEDGFTCDDLRVIHDHCASLGITTELMMISPPDVPKDLEACIFIMRGGVNTFLGMENGADMLLAEHNGLDSILDRKAKMKGRVVNKIARYNLCFSDFDQAPDYEKGMGTVVNFNRLPYTNALRDRLPMLFGEKSKNMQGEGNYYYDIKKTYIKYHGDTERRRVIGVRLGSTFPLFFQWFHRFKAIGSRMDFILNHGDIYIMSEKAVGVDWKSSSIYTLRHAAGLEEVLDKVSKK